jgi:hypothetical protein
LSCDLVKAEVFVAFAFVTAWRNTVEIQRTCFRSQARSNR